MERNFLYERGVLDLVQRRVLRERRVLHLVSVEDGLVEDGGEQSAQARSKPVDLYRRHALSVVSNDT